MSMKTKPTNEQIIEAAANHKSATAAAASLGIHYVTYRKRAKQLGVFIANPAGRGISKSAGDRRIPTEDILSGMHPQYQSNLLRLRLLEEGIKDHQCEMCGITEWMGYPAPLELDHIDGNKYNHYTSNLRMLCPNCHAQTGTYRGKNARVAKLVTAVDLKSTSLTD
jgi:HNH endonuclease